MVFFFIILNKDKQDIQFITSFSTFLSPPQPFNFCKDPAVVFFIFKNTC